MQFVGVATIRALGYAINNTGNRPTLTGAAFGVQSGQQVNSADFTHTKPTYRLADGEDRIQGFGVSDEAEETLALSVVVRAATLSAAGNQLLPPTDGAIVTLSNCHSPAGNTTLLNGDWIYLSGWAVNFPEGAGEATIKLTVHRYPGATRTAAQLMTAIS